MDRQALIDEVHEAMQDRSDMDVTLSMYAAVAVDRLGWRDLSKEKPDNSDMVIATDGKARWMDTYLTAMPEMTWAGGNRHHVATHWHPVLDLPSALRQSGNKEG